MRFNSKRKNFYEAWAKKVKWVIKISTCEVVKLITSQEKRRQREGPRPGSQRRRWGYETPRSEHCRCGTRWWEAKRPVGWAWWGGPPPPSSSSCWRGPSSSASRWGSGTSVIWTKSASTPTTTSPPWTAAEATSAQMESVSPASTHHAASPEWILAPSPASRPLYNVLEVFVWVVVWVLLYNRGKRYEKLSVSLCVFLCVYNGTFFVIFFFLLSVCVGVVSDYRDRGAFEWVRVWQEKWLRGRRSFKV